MKRKIKCPKCQGTKYYSGRYGQTACEECDNEGKVFLSEYNKKHKEEIKKLIKES